MDDFVRNKLHEWGLSELEKRFEDHEVTEESLFYLIENDITELIPKIGQRARFRNRLEQLKDAVEADGVYEVLEKNMETQLDQVTRAVEEVTMEFENLLTQGVQRCQTSEVVDCFLNRATLTNLRNVVDKNQPKPENDLNIKLASCLTDNIHERFKNCFQNDCETGSLIGVISRFSLGTNLLIPKYKDVKEQLTFLQTRENKIKEKIKTIIIQEKEAIYNSLSETIKKNMEEGYDAADRISGPNEKMKIRDTIKRHILAKQNMFNDAKTTMLGKMNTLKMTICNELKGTMEYFIKLLFKEVKKRERTDSTVPGFDPHTATEE